MFMSVPPVWALILTPRGAVGKYQIASGKFFRRNFYWNFRKIVRNILQEMFLSIFAGRSIRRPLH
jgi:hypothetical protein